MQLHSATPATVAAVPDLDCVRFFACTGQSRGSQHDLDTKASVARGIAELLGLPFGAHLQSDERAHAQCYVVPSHTLKPELQPMHGSTVDATRFFGGFVPYPFIASKLISHPLWRADAKAPAGWSHTHGAAIEHVVLPGRSVFSLRDARGAGAELLASGPIRIKAGDGVGGAGQSVISNRRELDSYLEQVDPQAVDLAGLVIELDISEETTCSVGQVQIGPWRASYFGTQQMTRTGRGHSVYGGSTLTVVRGGLDVLAGQLPDDATRLAVTQARVYHDAALRNFPGLVASRCNYDIIQGTDAQGRWRSGVLEQSWRIGGASGAEVAALLVLRSDPALRRVRALTREVYGDAACAPAGATVHYDGVDQHGEHLVKYVEVSHIVNT